MNQGALGSRDSTLTDKVGTIRGRLPISASGLCVQALKGWRGFCSLTSVGTPAVVSLGRNPRYDCLQPGHLHRDTAVVSLGRNPCHGHLQPAAPLHLRKRTSLRGTGQALMSQLCTQCFHMSTQHPASCLLGTFSLMLDSGRACYPQTP